MKSGLVGGMKGCDENVTCECGFKICLECYLDCVGNVGGRSPGCKESFNYVSDDEDEEEISENEVQPLPSPSMEEFNLDIKAQNHPPDFDHTRWLFETKGTYGYGNAGFHRR